LSFLTDYFEITEGAREVAVCCPFPHFTASGIPYQEQNPSAHVNTYDKLFHCKVCGTGYSEAQFIQHLFDCTYMDAKRLQRAFDTVETEQTWTEETQLSPDDKALAVSLGISEEAVTELKIATPPDATGQLAFPIFMFGHLMDVRIYNREHKPKVKSRWGATSGLILPYDIWRYNTDRVTLLCAGEKDMAVARSNGFNAITITGGESCLPKMRSAFKNRDVAIVYDHDDAGQKGARRLAYALHSVARSIKVCTNFHEICKEPKEDITDFFVKYGKTRADLIQYLKATPDYTPQVEDHGAHIPLLDLQSASRPEFLGRLVCSNIQVVATSESTFAAPAGVTAEKYRKASDQNLKEREVMFLNEVREWELTDETLGDVLQVIDNNFTEDQIESNLKDLMRVPQKERYVKMRTLMKRTVYKGYVTDMFETNSSASTPMEFTAYSIGCRLESGKKYMATYKLVPHPYKGQQITMIISDLVQANDSVSNFKLTDANKQHLSVFRNLTGTVEDRLTLIVEKFKGLLGYNGNNTLIQAMDLAYHTPLQFHFGAFQNVRGYLDTLVVGESRVGKSSTAEAMRNTYGLGVFTSLAGNSATIPGLIGGSNKTANGYQTRAGIIPQNHRGLIIFEEFGKSQSNLAAELTDIRSSNEVRIARVSGAISMPAMVRMITLSNVKHNGGGSRPIAAYPNGISIITELVDSAEDIARYDMLVVLGDRGAHNIDPFWQPQAAFEKEQYQARLRWVWSRTPEQIQISRDVGLYIMHAANALNAEYECHLKIFGTEAWKKVARLAIAIAGYLVSTDDTYTNLILEEAHVNAAIEFFKRIYDNPTFKLKEYVVHERRFSTLDRDGIAALQDIYDRFPSLVLQLEQSSKAGKQMLGSATGLGAEELNRALNRLSKGLFIQFNNYDILPTERFRLGASKINRNTNINQVGEG